MYCDKNNSGHKIDDFKFGAFILFFIIFTILFGYSQMTFAPSSAFIVSPLMVILPQLPVSSSELIAAAHADSLFEFT